VSSSNLYGGVANKNNGYDNEEESEQRIVWDAKSIDEYMDKMDRGVVLKGQSPFMEGNKFLRRIRTTYSFSDYEIEEMYKCKQDIIYFAENYVYISNDGLVFKIMLRDYQRRILKSFQRENMHVMLASRQSSKTTIVSIFLLWYSIFHNYRTVLATAHKESGMVQTLRNVRLIYDRLPYFMKPGINQLAVTSMNFENGSRILGSTTTEDSGRSIPVSVLYCLDGETTVKIRNKKTGVVEDVTLEKLYTMCGNKDNS